MSYFKLNVDPRERQYARLVGGVLATLRKAVGRRVEEGLTQSEIAQRIGMDKSALSRILNGRVTNLTARTIADVLWATEHEAVEFDADAYEDLSPDHLPQHLIRALAGPQSCPMEMTIIYVSGEAADAPSSHRLVRQIALANG